MPGRWHAVEACPLCSSSDLETRFPAARDSHYGISGLFPVYACRNCSLVFLNPMPDERELASLYPDSYYAYRQFAQRGDYLKAIAKKLLLIGTKDPVFRAPGRVLDLGCGSGKFLHVLREKGWDAYGIEINPQAAELGRRSAGLNIFAGNLFDAAFPDNYFDYVRAYHSFEHLVNPNEMLDEIHRILKSTGKLLIGVPNIESFTARIFGQNWWYLGIPVHPFNYSIRTLSMMLERHRFVVERIVFNSGYSGILGSVQIFLHRDGKGLPAEGRLIRNPFLIVVCQVVAKLLDLFKMGDAIEVIARKAEMLGENSGAAS